MNEQKLFTSIKMHHKKTILDMQKEVKNIVASKGVYTMQQLNEMSYEEIMTKCIFIVLPDTAFQKMKDTYKDEINATA